jgi:hypothetical protein
LGRFTFRDVGSFVVKHDLAAIHDLSDLSIGIGTRSSPVDLVMVTFAGISTPLIRASCRSAAIATIPGSVISSPRFSREEADVLAWGDPAETVNKGVIEDHEPSACCPRAAALLSSAKTTSKEEPIAAETADTGRASCF